MIQQGQQANATQNLGQQHLGQQLAANNGMGTATGGLKGIVSRSGLTPLGHVALRRYDAQTDELVPVDQEWIDLAQRTVTRLHLELQEAKRQITQLTILAPVVEAEPDTNTIDHMWRMVEAFGR